LVGGATGKLFDFGVDATRSIDASPVRPAWPYRHRR
jgi:hypothetical protein